jgi:hypothetical protein
MKLSQILRRWQWRLRRLVHRPADNDPLVSMEPPGGEAPPPASPGSPRKQAPKKRLGVRGVVVRILWLVLAFLVTLAVLAGLYVVHLARESRVAVMLDPPASAERVNGSPALMAAADLITEAAQPADALADHDLLLAPTARRVREAALNDGAAAAAARFLGSVTPRGAKPDPALSEARFALAGGLTQRAPARAALLKANDRAARGLLRIEAGGAAHRAMLQEAIRAFNAEIEGLEAAAAAGGYGPASPQAERRFFRARGMAWGWRRLLLGWLKEGPENAAAQSRNARLAPALAAMAEAANLQPTFLANAPPGSSFQPNHLSELAGLLARASLRLQDAAAPLP